jgi:hypothetical protein
MRVLSLFLLGSLGLLIPACGGSTVDRGRPEVKKELLPGKWEVTDDSKEFQHIQACEFTDGKLTMTALGLAEPVPGTYTWADDRTIEVTFQATDKLKKAFKDAMKAIKKPRLDKIGNAKDPISAGKRKSVEAIPDELPPTQKYKVIIQVGKKNTDLVLDSGTGANLEFKKVK